MKLSAATMLAITLAWSCASAQTADADRKSRALSASPAKVFFVLPTELVFESGPTKESPRESTEREPILSLCRGEVEPIQLVIEAGKEAVSGIRLEIEDLKTDDGAALQASAWEVRRVGYVEDDGRWWPDPLLPMSAEAISVSASSRRAFWLTLKTTEATPPGIFRGKLRVHGSGEMLVELPICVRVWDFSFPKPFPMGVVIGSKIDAAVLPMALERHCFPFFGRFVDEAPSYTLDTNGSLHADFSKFDETVKKLRSEWGLRYLCLPFVLGDGAGYPYWEKALLLRATDPDGKTQSVSIDPHLGAEERQRFGNVLRQFVEHLRQKNWLHDSYVWLWDEPHKPELVEQANVFAEYFHEAAPEFKLMLTTRAVSALSPHIGVFCALVNHATDEDSRWCKKNGKDYWLYTCGNAQHPSLTVGKPALDARMFGWIGYRFETPCVLEWAINRHCERMQWQADGWRCKGLLDSGDGMLVYPPLRRGDPPCPSIRSENLRDGVEDASLLRMVERFREDPKRGTQARAFIKEAAALVPNQRQYNLQPNSYRLLRNRLGSFIERSQHE